MAINNPIINPSEGDFNTVAQNPLSSLFSRLWLTAVILGGLAVLIYFLWGALEWITSGGDTEKIKNARHKITDAIIGLGILVASFAVILFLKVLFGFDLLNIKWPTA